MDGPDPSHDGCYDGYQMYFKSISGGSIRTLFEVLKEVLHDVSLVFDESGIKLVTMDGSRCALIYLKLRAEAFEQYWCPGTLRCGLNMTNTYKLLRTMGASDTVEMYAQSDNVNELGIRITNIERKSVTDFKLKLLDVDTETIEIPPVEFDAVLTLPSAYLQRMCRDMYNLSETIVVEVDADQLVLSCDGDFARQETTISSNEACMNVHTRASKHIQGRFALKYLTLFCRASALSTTVELFIKEKYPFVMKYHVASLGELRFALAPKMDDV